MKQFSIEFENFKRFKKFEPLDFSMINYLVGRNNSGKSTAVKAFMLIQDYLLNQLNNVIKFNRQEIEGLNIATFGNAINNTADADKIRFNLTLDEHTIELVLIQEDRQKDFAYVTQLQVLSKDKTYVLDINYLEKSISFKKTKMDIQQSNLDAKKNIIKDRIKELTKTRDLEKDFGRIAEINNKIQQESSKLKKIVDTAKDGPVDTFYELLTELPLIFTSGKSNTVTIQMLLDYILSKGKEGKVESHSKGLTDRSSDFQNKLIEDRSMYRAMDNDSKGITNWFNSLQETLNSFQLNYISANSSKQRGLYLLSDRQNPLSQSIIDYHRLNIMPGSEVHRFIMDWMIKFEVGNDFESRQIHNQAYDFRVKEENAWIELSEKGMGSLQAMNIILRLASLIQELINTRQNTNYIVMVEEPEINLHPALQAKLTELFHYCANTYQLRFIIETHSEYLIRKAQTIVKAEKYDEELNPNPFKVYYFPLKESIYEMPFRKDGKFTKDFKSGFFDVSSKLTLELF